MYIEVNREKCVLASIPFLLLFSYNSRKSFGNNDIGVIFVSKKKHKGPTPEPAPRTMDMSDSIRLNPEMRLCSKFDSTGIAKFRTGSKKKMGMRVLDDCAEEHIM